METSERVTRLSFSLDPGLAREVREHAGPRGLSAFITRAVRHERERERLGAYLAELEELIGPPDPELVAEYDALWRDL
ncbi:MAG: hypothetical protein ACRD0K_04865 [Egibacteraceae bacterium]